MTVSELLKKAANLAGNDRLLEIEVLLCHTLGVDMPHLIMSNNISVKENFVTLFNSYLKRFLEGEPVSYITQNREFYGLDFFVDNRVLVPRPETEEIVDRAITYIQSNTEHKKNVNVLDVGTGSGNIAISVVKTLEDLPVYAEVVDISDEAIEVAKLNIEQHNLEDRVEAYQSNLLENVKEGSHFEVITANLPYIGTKKNRFVEKNVEKYEPSVALFGGETGIELYEELFLDLISWGITFELLIGEFGFAQGEIIRTLLDKYFKGAYKIVKDLAGIERIFLVKGIN